MLDGLFEKLCGAAGATLLDEFEQSVRQLALKPEQALILALLEDGLRSYLDNLGARSRKRQALCAEAREWIFALPEDEKWIFTFSSCCELLGLDPDWVRSRTKTRELILSGRSERITRFPCQSVSE
jgi:hypothetical protein